MPTLPFIVGYTPIGGDLTSFDPLLPGDIATVWDAENGRADWKQSGVTLASGNDLATAVFNSLFSDRIAEDGDVPPDGSDDRRGWWGDIAGQPPLGSRLWLLDRAKLGSQTAVQAKAYVAEALQWLKDDGIAARIDVSVNVVLPSRIEIFVTVHRGDGAKVALQYQWVWQGIN